MSRKISGPATIYIGDKEIDCTIESMEIETEIAEFNHDPIELCYEGTVTLTSGSIETPKEDDRIGSRILPKYFKSITLGKNVYGRISRSLDKLGVKK